MLRKQVNLSYQQTNLGASLPLAAPSARVAAINNKQLAYLFHFK